ncbi:MAG: DUF1549 and DUF1553 domain-containing protein [Pirellulaceae bacterium]|nr:DUF1549 and DUF1553 domain-containing protein [Pirellulaceae bacterium]
MPAISLAILLALLAGPATADDNESSGSVTAADLKEAAIADADREHWAYLPLRRPALPQLDDAAWARQPIDLFVLDGMRARQLTPASEASPADLLRRVYFDLIGLPPSRAAVLSFQRDHRPGAYERVVDRLLASPEYGRRWAQHWLDLARFAETDGFEHDKVRPNAWRYRDWVVDALNDDLPYNQFVQQQLAGDELHADSPRTHVATGFCLSGPDMPDINSQVERRHTLLNELTSTVGSVFLGLQFGCAQCHDHKYDPISQADFYRLRAFFEPAVFVKKNVSVSLLKTSGGAAAASHLMIRGDWRRPGPRLEPAFPRIANAWRAKPELEPSVSRGRRASLARWLTRRDHPLTLRVAANRLWQFHFGAGLSETPSDFGVMGYEPVHGELLDYVATELVASEWSLKRLHRMLVTSATYRQASRPRLDAGSSAIAAWRRRVERDPSNEWLTRFPPRRLSGEEIRDAMLACSGALLHRSGGPSVRPPLPPELLRQLLRNQWNVSEDVADHHRRSIYVFARRNLRYPIFDAFDRPDANASCSRRARSTTAPQSLFLLNSELTAQLAEQLAGEVSRQGELRDWVDEICLRAWGRAIADGERDVLLQFLESQRGQLRESGRGASELRRLKPVHGGVDPYLGAALVDLCIGAFNSNEFVYAH